MDFKIQVNLLTMLPIEESLVCKNIIYCGVDEAGAGPLCGDVVAAAVILPQGVTLEGLTDSKKLTEKKREALFEMIINAAIAYGIARATVEEIDQINILQARMLAMSRAVTLLNPAPQFALIDGNRLPDQLPCEASSVVKGDALVQSIAAASVLAKVTRDREMIAMDQQYPEYGFAKHKGYGTKAHLMALETHGPSPIHRRSYAPIRALLEEN